MEDKFITTLFFTIFWSSLLIAGEDESPFCNTQPPGLTGYNQSCSNNSKCVTGHCTDSKCVCDDGATFSTCAVACVPDIKLVGTYTTSVNPTGYIIDPINTHMPRIFKQGISISSSANAQNGLDILYAKDCNSTVTGTTGTITSPSYPQSFAAYCTWTIQGPMETYIAFDLKYMNTSTVKNCSSDYLQIFDGPSASHIMYNLMCITWETFTVSTGNNMHIVFRTTGSLQFIATFNIYDRHSSLYEEGKLASPGYPLEYLNNQEFTWNLSARADTRLILNISFMETESCQYDYITVYDGATKNAPSSKEVCGQGVSDVIVSTKNNLFVTFKTDRSVRYRGFYAEFYTHDIRNVILNEPQGIISSSGYPFDNLDNMIYTLTIQGKADSYIHLNILGLGEDCQYDYLRIYDGPATFSPSFGNFCSSVPPGLMVSTGNSMFVVLKTKSDNKYKGNYGNYELRERDCTLNEAGYLASPGYPLRYLNNQKLSWTLDSLASKYIILNLSFVETKSCDEDYITVYDGDTRNAQRFYRICGTGVSRLIVTTTNKLLVTFKTNNRYTARGFYGEFYSLNKPFDDVMVQALLGLTVLIIFVFVISASYKLLIARYKLKNQHDNLGVRPPEESLPPPRRFQVPPRRKKSGRNTDYSGCSTVYITATENTDPSNEYDEIGECTV